MPYDANNIDNICTDCGRVVSGPHKDEIVRQDQRQVVNRLGQYKGAGISDTQCESCQMNSENERQMTEKYGKDWRTKGQQRKVQIDAEEAAKVHPWWRKL